MEFRFNVNEIFSTVITKVDNTLLPVGFQGNRELSEAVVAVTSEVLTTLGKLSAIAQDLKIPVTDALRLKQSDHVVYILVDPKGANSRGTVVGFLKVGRKKLFLYDQTGRCVEMEPLCILDFYIHESMQRSGMGLMLYKHMLQAENILPCYLAIDRPSEKLLCFLSKHYRLTRIIPQPYNFVVFEGFFRGNPYLPIRLSSRAMENVPSPSASTPTQSEISSARITEYFSQMCERLTPMTTRIGRYAAPKPPTTVGKILQDPKQSPPRRTGIVCWP